MQELSCKELDHVSGGFLPAAAGVYKALKWGGGLAAAGFITGAATQCGSRASDATIDAITGDDEKKDKEDE